MTASGLQRPEPTAEPMSTEPEVPAEDQYGSAETPETPEEPGTETPADTDSTQKPSGLTWEQMNEIAAVQEQLDFLPSEVTTPEEVEAIVAATKEYEALSEAQKAYIESDSLVLLQTAQERSEDGQPDKQRRYGGRRFSMVYPVSGTAE